MKNLNKITGIIQVTNLKKIMIGGLIAINLGITLNYQYQIATLKTEKKYQLEIIKGQEEDIGYLEENSSARQAEIDKSCKDLWVEENGK